MEGTRAASCRPFLRRAASSCTVPHCRRHAALAPRVPRLRTRHPHAALMCCFRWRPRRRLSASRPIAASPPTLSQLWSRLAPSLLAGRAAAAAAPAAAAAAEAEAAEAEAAAAEAAATTARLAAEAEEPPPLIVKGSGGAFGSGKGFGSSQASAGVAKVRSKTGKSLGEGLLGSLAEEADEDGVLSGAVDGVSIQRRL